MDGIRLGIIGCGARGAALTRSLFCGTLPGLTAAALCDINEERAQELRRECLELGVPDVRVFTDARELLEKGGIDAAVVAAGWDEHFPLTLACLESGVPVGTEVGGAYSVEQCFELVREVERTGTRFMFLENCCYGRTELLLLNMARLGLFGRIVHCTGAYRHDLRRLLCEGIYDGGFRLKDQLGRSCDAYPTHALGPIAKILRLNRGNRMISLTSTVSGAFGLNDFARKNERYSALAGTRFAQGDVADTVIRCAGGETVSLTFSISLPGPYSRNLGIYGTAGCYSEANRSFFIEDDRPSGAGENGRELWGNEKEYAEKYGHPLWKEYAASGAAGPHGGMDGLMFLEFAKYIRGEIECPVDVYDAASWMAVSALSEASAALGGAPQPIPDFTGGKWIRYCRGF